MCTFIFYKYFLNHEDTRYLNFRTEFLTKGFQRFLLSWCLFLVFFTFAATCSFHTTTYFEISVGMDGPFLLIVAAMLWSSAMYPRQFHALFNALLACSACYWLVPWLFRLLLACSLVVPLVTGLFLSCSACYWLVPLVPCFSNVELQTQNSYMCWKADI